MVRRLCALLVLGALLASATVHPSKGEKEYVVAGVLIGALAHKQVGQGFRAVGKGAKAVGVRVFRVVTLRAK